MSLKRDEYQAHWEQAVNKKVANSGISMSAKATVELTANDLRDIIFADEVMEDEGSPYGPNLAPLINKLTEALKNGGCR
jgi:hypothetical protein